MKVFPDYLDRLAIRAKEKGVRAVIVLDALNQLEDRERGRLLAWLAVSAAGGAASDRLHPARRHARCPQAARLARAHGRAAHGGGARPVDRPLPGSTSARGFPRPAPRRSRAWRRPPIRFTSRPCSTTCGSPAPTSSSTSRSTIISRRPTSRRCLGKILARYERDYERDRPGLVREALSLLWAARRGLTEPELLEVLKSDGAGAPAGCALVAAALCAGGRPGGPRRRAGLCPRAPAPGRRSCLRGRRGQAG